MIMTVLEQNRLINIYKDIDTRTLCTSLDSLTDELKKARGLETRRRLSDMIELMSAEVESRI